MAIRMGFILAVVCLLLAGCTKEGPAGPAGPAGASGQDGGDMHVEGFTAPSSEWVQLSNGLEFTQQVPSLTQEVIDNDAVLLFMGTNGIWHVLPYQVNALRYTYSYQVGQVTITVTGTQIASTVDWKLVYVRDSE